MSQLALQLFTMHQFKCIYHFQNSTISGEIGKTMGFNYQCMTQVLKIALPRRENKGINVHIPEPSPNLIVAEDDKHIVVVSDQGDCLGVPERIRGLEEIFVSQGCDSTSCFSKCISPMLVRWNGKNNVIEYLYTKMLFAKNSDSCLFNKAYMYKGKEYTFSIH